MKKLFAIVLMLVLVFSLCITSFAYPHSSTEMEALNEIEYWTWAIWNDSYSVFTENIPSIQSHLYNILSNILDVNDFTRSIYSEIKSLNNNLFGPNAYLVPLAETLSSNLSSLNDEFILFSDSFFNNISWGEPFAEVVQNNLVSLNDSITTIFHDVHQLKEVLASDEDLAIRDSQSQNLLSSAQLFLNGGSSDSSLGANDFMAFKGMSSSVFQLFSFTPNYNVASQFTQFLNYFSYIGEAVDWFTESTYNSLVTVPSTYSLRDDSNRVVTHYYEDTLKELYSLVGGE